MGGGASVLQQKPESGQDEALDRREGRRGPGNIDSPKPKIKSYNSDTIVYVNEAGKSPPKEETKKSPHILSSQSELGQSLGLKHAQSVRNLARSPI